MTPRGIVLEQLEHHETRPVPFTLSFESDVAERGFFAELLDRLTELFLAHVAQCVDVPVDAIMFGDEAGRRGRSPPRSTSEVDVVASTGYGWSCVEVPSFPVPVLWGHARWPGASQGRA